MSKQPTRPQEMNGEHAALWGFMMHLNGRMDRLFQLGAGILVTLIGVLIVLLTK